MLNLSFLRSWHFQEWHVCQKKCNTIQLNQRIKDFDVSKLHPEIAARGYQILAQHRLEDVRDKSEGVAVFYAWVRHTSRLFKQSLCKIALFKVSVCVTW